jgi:hypothetical protein
MHDPRSHSRRERYPGYDVLSKRNSLSWNEQTRRVITRRLAVNPEPRFFSSHEFRTVAAIAARLVPQPVGRPPVPVAALVDQRLFLGKSDGYRESGMPRDGEAWKLGLKALDSEAGAMHGKPFRELQPPAQENLLRQMQTGDLTSPAWAGMKPASFFKKRMARDVVMSYYAHPSAWSEIGWGGPASPRGYVRLDFNERDPWEPAEANGANDEAAKRINRHV